MLSEQFPIKRDPNANQISTLLNYTKYGPNLEIFGSRVLSFDIQIVGQLLKSLAILKFFWKPSTLEI